MFPVHLYREGFELPTEGTYFLVAGNGTWMHKDTGIVKAFIPVEHVSVLSDFDAKLWVSCNLPKLPPKYVWQIKYFFKRVVELLHTEASVTLYFNKKDQTFKLIVPEQKVYGGGVEYKRKGMTHEPDMADFLRVGTIHSHCDFGAFHSGTDQRDEIDFDGLHCTFGHNNRDEFTIAASVVVNAYRLVVDPLTVLDGIEHASGENYRLLPVGDATEWEKEVEPWLPLVSAGVSEEEPEDDDEIAKGDKLEWAGDLKTVSFRSMCGEGPFVADSVDDDNVTVQTNVGLARFSRKLFRKVSKHGQQ